MKENYVIPNMEIIVLQLRKTFLETENVQVPSQLAW